MSRSSSTVLVPQLVTSAEQRFVDEYLSDLDARSAAARAGLDPALGPKFLARHNVQRAIANEKKRRASRTALDADKTLRRWVKLAEAKATELYQVYVPSCRYCWGVDGRYQFTKNELQRAKLEHQAAQREKHPDDTSLREDFDEEGGDGYDRTRRPNPDCTECNGVGNEPFAVIRDTRDLSDAGLLLLDGIETKADGSVKVSLRNRNWAETMVARHLGMISEGRRIDTLDPTMLSDSQLDVVLMALIRRNELGPVIDAEAQDVVTGDP